MILFEDNFEHVSYHLFDQMTKVIVVLRHAQSAGKQSGQRDYDRALTPQGQATAKALGQKLKQQNYNFQFILSSSSTRTRQTVELINETLQLSTEKILFKPELYEAMMVHWLDHIYELPDDINHVLLVGHNPWLSILASTFAGRIRDLGPSELIGFEFKSETWREIGDRGQEIMNIK